MPRLLPSFYIQINDNDAKIYRSITTWAVSGLDISGIPKTRSDCSGTAITQKEKTMNRKHTTRGKDEQPMSYID